MSDAGKCFYIRIFIPITHILIKFYSVTTSDPSPIPVSSAA